MPHASEHALVELKYTQVRTVWKKNKFKGKHILKCAALYQNAVFHYIIYNINLNMILVCHALE